MGTTIITKNGSGAPAADDLVAGELAVDLTNKRLYTKDSGNNVLELGSSPSTIVFSSVASNITPSADDTYDLGATGTKWRDIYIDGTAYLDAINFNGTAITATAAELNILDGVTSTAAELNILDGVTSTAAELNILDGVTATTAELNILDGVTSTTAELNILDGVTSTTAELNILDGVTATATELNYVDGVTSAIQTQLDAKAPTASPTLTGTITAADLIISSRQIATADASGTNTAGNNVTLKAGASTGSAAGGSLIFQTTPAGSTGTLVNSFSTIMTLDESGIDVAGAVEFDSLSGTGSVSVTDILDQDDMSSDSATALATQQSIKAYVDSQIGSNNELSEVLAAGNTSGGTGLTMSSGDDLTLTGASYNVVWDSSDNALEFADNAKAVFGTDSDLSIYHNGSNGFVENDTGLLILKNNSDDRDVAIQSDDGSGGIANYLLADGSTGALNAYHYGSLKLATTSTGIDVTGTVTADDLDVNNLKIESDVTATPTNDGANYIFRASGSHADYAAGDLVIQARSSAARDIYFTTGTPTPVNRMVIDSSGNVGIGTSSPVTLKSSTTLQVDGNAKLGDDNGRGLLSLGDISSTGANVGIWRGAAGAYAGTGNYLNLGGYDGITFTTGNAEIASQTERLRIDSSGQVGIGTSSVLMQPWMF